MSNHIAGLVSVSFRPYSVNDILVATNKNGLSCIEWGSDVHAPCDDVEKLNEIVRLQNEYGIYCSSYGTYFKLGVSGINELEQYINAAKILGTDVIRIWCGNRNCNLYSAHEKETLMKQAKMAADIAQKKNVFLCMECHNNSYTETVEGALELMQTVDSENFRMYWQPNQFVSVEKNVEYALAISEYVKNIHVFNWKERERYSLNEAVYVWKKYLNCFKEPKHLLLEFMPDDRIESLAEESAALFKILESI